MQLETGTRLGPYEIVAPLGAGGMGEVYRARDTRLDRTVAIKVLPASLASDPERRMRFEREARAAAALAHPHICALYDIGRDSGRDFLVMQYLEGETLAERLARARQAGGTPGLPFDEACRHAIEIAQALEASHARGIVHRDLKPGNIMITAAGVSVLDFGLAKLEGPALAAPGSGDAATIDRTGAGQILGTLAYMSPEQIRGEEVDHRSDIWSFGAVLFEMLGGRAPFTGATAADTLSAILRDPLPRLDLSVAGAFARFQPVLDGCLAKGQGARYQQIADVRAALERAMQASGSAAQPRARTDSGLVVLPFVNLSPDPDNAYFADGLTEEVIADLSKVRALRVISRTSSMALKGDTRAAPTLARELGVRYVLTGSVRRASRALRITAQLVDALTDTPLWSEKFSGTVDDVFDLQETLSRTIVDALSVTLTPDESRRLAARPIGNAEAYAYLMKARQLYMHFTKEALDEAMGLIERARALVGDNPLVLATMAHIHWNYHNIGVAGSDDSPRLARELSARALELDPDQPLALTVQASLAMRHDGHRVAIGLLERVVAVEPAVDALMWLTTFSIEIGQEARARHWVARAIAVDPLSPLPRFLSGWVDMHVGRFDAALRCVTPLGDDHPADFFLQFFTAVVEIHAGADETAKARFTRIAEADAQMWSVLSRMYLAALAGRRDEVVQLTSAESFAGLAKVDHQYSYFAAECLTECGEHDAALQWLANAIGLGMTNDEFFARHNRFLAPLRGDPRFEALMERARTAR